MVNSQRIFKVFVALFLLVELASCVSIYSRNPPKGKRPAEDDGRGEASTKKGTTPFDPTKKITPQEWQEKYMEMDLRSNIWGSPVWSSFVRQTAPKAGAFFKKPGEAADPGAIYSMAELGAFARLSFGWVMNTEEAKDPAFWQFVTDSKPRLGGSRKLVEFEKSDGSLDV
jgi:hypothetical protein